MRKDDVGKLFTTVKTNQIFLTMRWDLEILHEMGHDLIDLAFEGDPRNKELYKLRNVNHNGLLLNYAAPRIEVSHIEGTTFVRNRDLLYKKHPNYNFYVKYIITKNLETGQKVKWVRTSKISDFKVLSMPHIALSLTYNDFIKNSDLPKEVNTLQMFMFTINGRRINKKGKLLFSIKDIEIAAGGMNEGVCAYRPRQHLGDIVDQAFCFTDENVKRAFNEKNYEL